MKDKKEAKYDKDSFLKILSSATPQEINNIIEERGKEPKPRPLVYFY